VYDDVRARARQSDQTEPVDQPNHPNNNQDDTDDMRGWFIFVSGLPGHKVECDVSIPIAYSFTRD
jgi:hypothetical protein